eukprot:5080195-Prymnesium_polylepis.1
MRNFWAGLDDGELDSDGGLCSYSDSESEGTAEDDGEGGEEHDGAETGELLPLANAPSDGLGGVAADGAEALPMESVEEAAEDCEWGRAGSSSSGVVPAA